MIKFFNNIILKMFLKVYLNILSSESDVNTCIGKAHPAIKEI